MRRVGWHLDSGAFEHLVTPNDHIPISLSEQDRGQTSIYIRLRSLMGQGVVMRGQRKGGIYWGKTAEEEGQKRGGGVYHVVVAAWSPVGAVMCT